MNERIMINLSVKALKENDEQALIALCHIYNLLPWNVKFKIDDAIYQKKWMTVLDINRNILEVRTKEYGDHIKTSDVYKKLSPKMDCEPLSWQTCQTYKDLCK